MSELGRVRLPTIPTTANLPHQVRLLELAEQLLGSATALLAALPTQHGAALEAQQATDASAPNYLLLTTGSLLLTPYYWLLTTGSLLLAPYSLLLTTGFLLLAPYYWLLTTGSLLLAPYSLLLTTHPRTRRASGRRISAPYCRGLWTASPSSRSSPSTSRTSYCPCCCPCSRSCNGSSQATPGALPSYHPSRGAAIPSALHIHI